MSEVEGNEAEADELKAAERYGRPFIRYRDRKGTQKLFTLPETRDPVTVGRGAWMDIALPWDENVSRAHAKLERIGEDWIVIDDGLARNGTWVNGERVAGRRRLANGDEVRVGETTLVIHMPGRVDDATTALMDVPPPNDD